MSQDAARVLRVLRGSGQALTLSWLRHYTGLPGDRVRAALNELVEAGQVRRFHGRDVFRSKTAKRAIWWEAVGATGRPAPWWRPSQRTVREEGDQS